MSNNFRRNQHVIKAFHSNQTSNCEYGGNFPIGALGKIQTISDNKDVLKISIDHFDIQRREWSCHPKEVLTKVDLADLIKKRITETKKLKIDVEFKLLDLDASNWETDSTDFEQKYAMDRSYIAASIKKIISENPHYEKFPFEKVVVLSHNLSRINLSSLTDISESLDYDFRNPKILTILQRAYYSNYSITGSGRTPKPSNRCYYWTSNSGSNLAYIQYENLGFDAYLNNHSILSHENEHQIGLKISENFVMVLNNLFAIDYSDREYGALKETFDILVKQTLQDQSELSGFNKRISYKRLATIREQKTKERIGILRTDLNRQKSASESLDRKIFEISRNLSDQRTVVKSLEGLSDRIREDFNKLRDHPKIEKVLQREGLYIFETKDILLYDEEEREYNLGPYFILYDIEKQTLSIRSRIVGQRGYHQHPHVNDDGTPCMGNIRATYEEFMSNMEIFELIIMFVNFLEIYNGENPYVPLKEFYKSILEMQGKEIPDFLKEPDPEEEENDEEEVIPPEPASNPVRIPEPITESANPTPDEEEAGAIVEIDTETTPIQTQSRQIAVHNDNGEIVQTSVPESRIPQGRRVPDSWQLTNNAAAPNHLHLLQEQLPDAQAGSIAFIDHWAFMNTDNGWMLIQERA